MNKRQKQKQEAKQKLDKLQQNVDLWVKVLANENSKTHKKVKVLKERVEKLEKRERTMSYLIMAWATIQIVKWMIK